MNQGAWITLHFVQPMPLSDGSSVHNLTGYLENDPRTASYKLTKMVTKSREERPAGTLQFQGLPVNTFDRGTVTTIHEGTWLIAPQFVWMIEYEKETPVAGFVPEDLS